MIDVKLIQRDAQKSAAIQKLDANFKTANKPQGKIVTITMAYSPNRIIPYQVKKDAIWKPVFRIFRRYYKV